jgi:serine/threonine-protein kinase
MLLMDKQPESSFALELKEKHVTRAWMAASISAGLTLLFGAFAAAGVVVAPGLDAWILLDAAILAALAYGVWKRSRVCAVLLFLYGIVNETYLALDETTHFSLLRVVFIYFYLRGAIQLFRDHRSHAGRQDVNT